MSPKNITDEFNRNAEDKTSQLPPGSHSTPYIDKTIKFEKPVDPRKTVGEFNVSDKDQHVDNFNSVANDKDSQTFEKTDDPTRKGDTFNVSDKDQHKDNFNSNAGAKETPFQSKSNKDGPGGPGKSPKNDSVKPPSSLTRIFNKHS